MFEPEPRANWALLSLLLLLLCGLSLARTGAL